MRGERGFALIGAMWLLVALAAVGLELSLAARARRLTALNVAELEQAEWAARAGLETARARLEGLLARGDAGPGADPWWNAGAFLPDTVPLGDAAFHVRARDANAGLNPNRADEAGLQRLLAALRVDAGDADRLAQAVADWRDADDFPRARGAEREAYLAAERPVLPRNGPFRAVGEMLDVLGMDPEVFERVRPYVTVIGTGRINLNTAPRPVLLSLPGIGEEAASVIERLRRGGGRVTSLGELAAGLPAPARAALVARMPELEGRVTFDTRELELVSDGWSGDGRVRVTARGLLVRARETAFLIGVRVE
jgi:general secretion pathway protein K